MVWNSNWQVFFFTLLYCLLVCIVSDKKPLAILIFVSVYVICLFSLTQDFFFITDINPFEGTLGKSWVKWGSELWAPFRRKKMHFRQEKANAKPLRGMPEIRWGRGGASTSGVKWGGAVSSRYQKGARGLAHSPRRSWQRFEVDCVWSLEILSRRGTGSVFVAPLGGE